MLLRSCLGAVPRFFLGKEGLEDLCAGGKLCVCWWQSDLNMFEHA